jgi:hypothetical protein
MPRVCTICTHQQRSDIEAALVGGGTFRNIAKRFSVSATALFRHRKEHLPGQLVEAQKQEDLGKALDVVRQLKAINAACLEVLQSSRKAGKDALSLRAVDRIHRQIELQARLLGELQEGPTVNVLVAPEWQQIRQVILLALEPHSAARADVVQALKGVSDECG